MMTGWAGAEIMVGYGIGLALAEMWRAGMFAGMF